MRLLKPIVIVILFLISGVIGFNLHRLPYFELPTCLTDKQALQSCEDKRSYMIGLGLNQKYKYDGKGGN